MVDIDNPYLLATFRLPLIYELALNFSHPDCSIIWEKRIAVNANLSGLNLLHMKEWPFNGDMIPILRLLPLLETLIVSPQQRTVSSRFPIDKIETSGLISGLARTPMIPYIGGTAISGLNQTSGEGQKLALLCPRLQRLQIESVISPFQP